MQVEQETEAGKLVKRNLGKILAASAGGFLVFACAVFVSIRYLTSLESVRSNPVRVMASQPAETVPVEVPTQTASATDAGPASTGLETVTGTGAPETVTRPKIKRRVRKSKQPERATDEAFNRTAPQQIATLATKETPTPVAQTPAPHPDPLVIPTNTTLAVRLTEPLSTKEVHKGGIFHGVLSAPLEANGRMVAAAGATVAGRIVDSRRAGLLGRHAVLSLDVLRVTDEQGHTIPVTTTQWYATGKRGILPTLTFRSRDENGAETSGTTEAKIRRSDISVPQGATLSFRLLAPVTIP